MATSVYGVLFSLFAGQPLAIMCQIGPLLLFDKLLYNFCDKNNLEFLELRFYVGVVSFIILMTMVFLKVSNLVKHFTSFTGECFASLALNFLIDGGRNLAESTDYSEGSNAISIGPYFSLIIAIITAFLANFISSIKGTRFFSTRTRGYISSLSVLISITISIWISQVSNFGDQIVTKTLVIPLNFETTSNRNWFVLDKRSSFDSILLSYSIGPALVLSALCFIGLHLTGVVCNGKYFESNKGGGYHLDLFLISVFILISACFGLPWMVTSAVRSLAHINGLSVKQTNQKLVCIYEQRLTGCLIGLITGLSIYFTVVLGKIPVSVLNALFILMGVETLMNLSVFERILLWMTPVDKYPDRKYLRIVELKMVHFYTLVQVCCLVTLHCIVKSDPKSSLFSSYYAQYGKIEKKCILKEIFFLFF